MACSRPLRVGSHGATVQRLGGNGARRGRSGRRCLPGRARPGCEGRPRVDKRLLVGAVVVRRVLVAVPHDRRHDGSEGIDDVLVRTTGRRMRGRSRSRAGPDRSRYEFRAAWRRVAISASGVSLGALDEGLGGTNAYPRATMRSATPATPPTDARESVHVRAWRKRGRVTPGLTPSVGAAHGLPGMLLSPTQGSTLSRSRGLASPRARTDRSAIRGKPHACVRSDPYGLKGRGTRPTIGHRVSPVGRGRFVYLTLPLNDAARATHRTRRRCNPV